MAHQQQHSKQINGQTEDGELPDQEQVITHQTYFTAWEQIVKTIVIPNLRK